MNRRIQKGIRQEALCPFPSTAAVQNFKIFPLRAWTWNRFNVLTAGLSAPQQLSNGETAC